MKTLGLAGRGMAALSAGMAALASSARAGAVSLANLPSPGPDQASYQGPTKVNQPGKGKTRTKRSRVSGNRKRFYNSSRYMPHQGARQTRRYAEQMALGLLSQVPFTLAPSGPGMSVETMRESRQVGRQIDRRWKARWRKEREEERAMRKSRKRDISRYEMHGFKMHIEDENGNWNPVEGADLTFGIGKTRATDAENA